MKTIKIGMFGGGGVGKTSITLQFVKGEFTDGYIPTIEDEFIKTIDFEGETLSIEIIDTAGQDDFQSMRFRNMSSVEGFILVYSILDPVSVSSLKEIHGEALLAKGTDSIPCIIAANKCDLRGPDSVPVADGENLAKEIGCQIYETSAKENINIQELYEGILKLLLSKNKEKKTTKKDAEPGCSCQIQ
ncbi:RAP1B, member of RAS oncogene family [Histomonas meleagridis]|uniref:RAP1B, member of RAS oncogene family n=1 Tax=Histomonas meleagridis TaxID=135588 RepID=UPI003559C3AC|nr:RAP1B, member of RAS oncogene family [Histomonas meleagridis]KAH0796429.1 RAP1B, member of RAS oncogene family [Histomonas meleagridis]